MRPLDERIRPAIVPTGIGPTSSDTGGHCPQGAWSWGTKRGEGPHCRAPRAAPQVGSGVFLAGKRVSVQFSRPYWQTNEFRSSRNAPRTPRDPFLEECEASNGTLSTDSVALTTKFRATQVWAVSTFRNHYSETRFAAIGPPRLLRNPICCQHDPRKPMDKPQTATPPTRCQKPGRRGHQGDLFIACLSPRTYRQPGRGRAGSRT